MRKGKFPDINLSPQVLVDCVTVSVCVCVCVARTHVTCLLCFNIALYRSFWAELAL